MDFEEGGNSRKGGGHCGWLCFHSDSMRRRKIEKTSEEAGRTAPWTAERAS